MIQNLLWNGQNAQKLKIAHKRYKQMKKLEIVLFSDEISKHNFYDEKSSFWPKISQKTLNQLKLTVWKRQIRPNNTKTKKTSKLLKHTQNSLEKSFHDQNAKQFFCFG